MWSESNTIGFENGIRWLTCVQGAPVPHGVTGAEMIERGKPDRKPCGPHGGRPPTRTKKKLHTHPAHGRRSLQRPYKTEADAIRHNDGACQPDQTQGIEQVIINA